MAVAKKAKKDGVEVKIETSNDAQKDKKHSKRKIKTATLETSGLTLSIESVEPEKTSKKAVKPLNFRQCMRRVLLLRLNP